MPQGDRHPWNPWRSLRGKSHIIFGIQDLPAAVGGAIAAVRNGTSVVVLDRGLSQIERNAALAHELIHHERGLDVHREGMPDTWDAVVQRDENAVDREVARRLVPLPSLRDFADAQADLGEGVEPWMVAEEFDVPWNVAVVALELLRDWERP